MVKTYVLTCPIDYDGAVFYVGYCSLELRDESDKIDKTVGFHTVDELPYFKSGHDYYFFSTKTLMGQYDLNGDSGSGGEKTDGTYNIHLYGRDYSDTWDWYYIDPLSLEGTNVLGEPVNLNDVMWQ